MQEIKYIIILVTAITEEWQTTQCMQTRILKTLNNSAEITDNNSEQRTQLSPRESTTLHAI